MFWTYVIAVALGLFGLVLGFLVAYGFKESLHQFLEVTEEGRTRSRLEDQIDADYEMGRERGWKPKGSGAGRDLTSQFDRV